MSEDELARIEDAALNASAPPQQRWLDGWLLRLSPGKARRARCVHALAAGRRTLDARLDEAQMVYRGAGLPLLFRITPFTQPPSLDAELAARGFVRPDSTLVMARPIPAAAAAVAPCPPGLAWVALAPADFAQAVGALRGSPVAEREAHAQRLLAAPVPGQGFALIDADAGTDAGAVLACGQFVQEGPRVGLYDVVTRQTHRGSGLASLLCERMLSLAAQAGADSAYLQVEADNMPALRVYRRLGFAPIYEYHYREAPGPG